MNNIITDIEALSLIQKKLERYYNISIKEASSEQLYKTLAMIVKDILLERKNQYHQRTKKANAKRVHYLCMEFLLGRTLKSSLFNLGLDEVFTEALKNRNIDINDIYEMEPDAGLGNGGLGRLAACFMDALATLDYPAMGHCIRYDYGLFKQKIVDGNQIELPDSWLPGGDVWLEPRKDKSVIVRFDGYIKETIDSEGHMVPEYYDYTEVEAYPYDMFLSGYDCEAVSTLRLWQAKSISKFDMRKFSQGEYMQALAQDNEAELISKVLYPSDDNSAGKSLRLKQQYFLVSAALQEIIGTHIRRYKNVTLLPEYVAIHINDTHPTLVIPELMRILMDDYKLGWDEAWSIVTRTVAYTNHTVLVEALETWNEDLIARTLPRVYQIIREINRRFSAELFERFKGENLDIMERMAIISKRTIKMANLCIVASHKVNGVSKLHSDILKNHNFKDFSNIYPDKFMNVTNGIAHRRWLCQSNPALTELLKEKIGEGFYKDAKQLEKFLDYAKDESVLKQLAEIKHSNKVAFAELIKKHQGAIIDPNSRFDVQVKRIHEYKRQLLNVLKIIHLYGELKANPDMDFTPQTFIIGGKAAPTYYMAKRIIKLINQLSAEIEKDPIISKKLRVLFIENYTVTIAESLMPAAEVSEQISLAGKEASGTGNMKFMINGALTLGTLDGANVEIREECGDENIFIFGMTADEVSKAWKLGYEPKNYYESNSNIRRVIDMLIAGFNGESFRDIADYLLFSGNVPDPYMCLADFDSYIAAHTKMDEIYKDKKKWNKMSLMNIGSAGFFAADRSIEKYAKEIWNLTKHGK